MRTNKSTALALLLLIVSIIIISCGGSQPRFTDAQILATADAIRAKTPTRTPVPPQQEERGMASPTQPATGLDDLWARATEAAIDWGEYLAEKHDRAIEAENGRVEEALDAWSEVCPYTNRDSNLRAGPGTNYPVIGFAPKGACIPVEGRNSAGTWYIFHDGEIFGDGVDVWIAAMLVEDAQADLPVFVAKATPVPDAPTVDEHYQAYLEDMATEAALNREAAAAEAAELRNELATLAAEGLLSDKAAPPRGCPGGCVVYPTWCVPPIKGNISIESKEKIYHVLSQEYYDATNIDPAYGERWFCTEEEAREAGWRKSRR